MNVHSYFTILTMAARAAKIVRVTGKERIEREI